jgi:coenzyme F420-reducing hydrogenase delta subunit
MDDYQPEILGLCCNYCSFAAADLAGSMRLTYPANVKIVRLNCSGKLDIIYMLRAFEKGADGIFAAG